MSDSFSGASFGPGSTPSGQAAARLVGSAGTIPSAEQCQRCGHENSVWCAPSPLWNAVIRVGCINGEPEFSDMVCAACFMSLAEQRGIATRFRVIAEEVTCALQTVTPSGRVWDEETWLWRPSPIGRGKGLKIPKSLGSKPRGATTSSQGIEAGTGETEGLDGASRESPVAASDAPKAHSLHREPVGDE